MKLLTEDLAWCITRLPKNIIKLMHERKDEVMLAGGFIRSCIANEKINDIDVFAKSKEKAELYATIIADGAKVISTDNAFTILNKTIPVQFIHRWTYEKPADILPSFDFTVARAVIWFDGEWQSLCDDRYYADLSAKRLVYCSPIRVEEVGGSLLRVLKFYQKGYRIPLDSLAAVISRLMSGINFNVPACNPEAPDRENSWARIMTGLLHEVDPNIDPTHLSHLPAIREIQEEIVF